MVWVGRDPSRPSGPTPSNAAGHPQLHQCSEPIPWPLDWMIFSKLNDSKTIWTQCSRWGLTAQSRGADPLPHPAGHAALDAAQVMVGFGLRGPSTNAPKGCAPSLHPSSPTHTHCRGCCNLYFYLDLDLDCKWRTRSVIQRLCKQILLKLKQRLYRMHKQADNQLA